MISNWELPKYYSSGRNKELAGISAMLSGFLLGYKGF